MVLVSTHTTQHHNDLAYPWIKPTLHVNKPKPSIQLCVMSWSVTFRWLHPDYSGYDKLCPLCIDSMSWKIYYDLSGTIIHCIQNIVHHISQAQYRLHCLVNVVYKGISLVVIQLGVNNQPRQQPMLHSPGLRALRHTQHSLCGWLWRILKVVEENPG